MSGAASRGLLAFYDGACPLCLREVRLLRRLDRAGRIRWVDIAAPGFDPLGYGKTQGALMARMHVRLPDGRWAEGVEAFRRLYACVGLGPLVWLTRLPGVAQALEAAYRVFARNRLRWTGRSGCEAGACRVPAQGPGAGAP